MTDKPFDIPCVILSGGKSSRMGKDKSLLPFDKYETLVEFQYEKLKPYFKNTYLSSKIDKFNFDTNLIIDDSAVYSPIVALKKVLETIDCNQVFIITVDTPFVKIETIQSLIEHSKGFDITVAKTSRTHNLCGVFDKTNLSIINNMLSEDIHKVGYLLKQINLNTVEFFDEMEFLNLNEIEDYKHAISNISYFYN